MVYFIKYSIKTEGLLISKGYRSIGCYAETKHILVDTYYKTYQLKNRVGNNLPIFKKIQK